MKTGTLLYRAPSNRRGNDQMMRRIGRWSTTRSRRLGGLLALLALVALAGSLPSSFAGDSPPPAPPEKPPLDNPNVERGSAATAVLLTGFPPGAGCFQKIALLRLGERIGCWRPLRDPSHVPPLDRRYFHAVRDKTRMPTAIDVDETQFQQTMVDYDAVRKAQDTPPEVFLKEARPDLTFAHLFEDSWRYRGEVVAIKGHLRRVRRFVPDANLKSKTRRYLYECWLYHEESGGNP